MNGNEFFMKKNMDTDKTETATKGVTPFVTVFHLTYYNMIDISRLNQIDF